MTEQQISEVAEIDELLGDDLENTERWLIAWADAIRKGYKTVDDFREQYGGNREHAEDYLGQSISEKEWQTAMDEVCAQLTRMTEEHDEAWALKTALTGGLMEAAQPDSDGPEA